MATAPQASNPTAPKAPAAPAASKPAATPAADSKPAKAERVVENVKMSDGRTVEFVGKRKLLKETIIEGNVVKVRLDFRNGETRTWTIPQSLILRCAGHGAEQKLGDETAGEEKVEDMVLAVDDLMARLDKGEWTTPRAAGDSFSGASIVIKALSLVTGKPVDVIKDFLQKKLDNAKAKGETLTRKALYDSFRNPSTDVGKKIRELEDAERAKSSGIDAVATLEELKAA